MSRCVILCLWRYAIVQRSCLIISRAVGSGSGLLQILLNKSPSFALKEWKKVEKDEIQLLLVRTKRKRKRKKKKKNLYKYIQFDDDVQFSFCLENVFKFCDIFTVQTLKNLYFVFKRFRTNAYWSSILFEDFHSILISCGVLCALVHTAITPSVWTACEHDVMESSSSLCFERMVGVRMWSSDWKAKKLWLVDIIDWMDWCVIVVR